MNYISKLERFNRACEAEYNPEVRFVAFRKTKKGIRVFFTLGLGKPHEIAELAENIRRAGAPYYQGWE